MEPFVASPPITRESACPVHFLWDSVGAGRWLVRLGFMGFLGAGLFVTGASMARVDALREASAVLALCSAASWVSGHALTRLQRLRRR